MTVASSEAQSRESDNSIAEPFLLEQPQLSLSLGTPDSRLHTY